MNNYCTRCGSFYSVPGTCNCFVKILPSPSTTGTANHERCSYCGQPLWLCRGVHWTITYLPVTSPPGGTTPIPPAPPFTVCGNG